MQIKLPLQIYNKRYKKEQKWIFQPKDMVVYINLKKYHMFIKKYKNVWKQYS
jgi:hypothetical protein